MPTTSSDAWRILLIVLAAVILIALIVFYSRKASHVSSESEESFVGYNAGQSTSGVQPAPAGAEVPKEGALPAAGMGAGAGPTNEAGVLPSEPLSNEDYKAVDYQTSDKVANGGACFPRDKLTADDLLPKDAANSKWAEVNPAGQGDVSNVNFLTAGYHIGINTVGQTLRNPNYQLRSEPPNPRSQVSPWNQSTIEFDNARRFFEVGTC